MSTVITLPNGNIYNLIPLPSYPGLAEIDFTMDDAIAVVPSPFNPGQVQTQQWPGADVFSATISLPKMNRQTAAPWRGFMAELRGMLNVFQIGDPWCPNPRGAANGAPVCATTGTNNLNSATQLYTSGWVPNTYGQLLAGDYIQIGYRLHQACENVNSDSSGNANFAIWPSLRESPANSTPIHLTNTRGLFRLATNQRTFHRDFTGLMQLSLKISEVR